ncbi:hypothetical protein nACB2_161 [Acinetobacter phage nACB2]|nr:hypothetical protein nACB2_161 [Acinetobacter phage nACB2]
MKVYAPNTDMMNPIESINNSSDKKLVRGTIFAIRKAYDGNLSVHLDYRINERSSMALQLTRMIRPLVDFINSNSPRTEDQVEQLIQKYCSYIQPQYKTIYDSAHHMIYGA